MSNVLCLLGIGKLQTSNISSTQGIEMSMYELDTRLASFVECQCQYHTSNSIVLLMFKRHLSKLTGLLVNRLLL